MIQLDRRNKKEYFILMIVIEISREFIKKVRSTVWEYQQYQSMRGQQNFKLYEPN